ncbi:uncharacterized protein LOC118145005 [Callithrix jacchus]|uniref:methyl-CpG-binding domain protein 2-like n=1 Tax=Callithrix jacchus TaxID=9483 RepID=UPI0023DD6350|nr:methyl-CpG-binding domain protein 2-like [Callithrix jacchus]
MALPLVGSAAGCGRARWRRARSGRERKARPGFGACSLARWRRGGQGRQLAGRGRAPRRPRSLGPGARRAPLRLQTQHGGGGGGGAGAENKGAPGQANGKTDPRSLRFVPRERRAQAAAAVGGHGRQAEAKNFINS